MTDQNAYSKLKRKYAQLERDFHALERQVEKKEALLAEAENLLKQEINERKTIKRTLENMPVMINALDVGTGNAKR